MCCIVLQCVAMCCSVLQCMLQYVLQCVAVCVAFRHSKSDHKITQKPLKKAKKENENIQQSAQRIDTWDHEQQIVTAAHEKDRKNKIE